MPSILETLQEEFAPEGAYTNALKRCLEYIWTRLGMRARLFLQEGDDLILRGYVGTYDAPPQIGLRVHAESVVWEISEKGQPVNLTDSHTMPGRPHTLPEPIVIKAVIPLISDDLYWTHGRSLGALIVDSGEPISPISERDFQYLQVVGMLISEILLREKILKNLNELRRERERMTLEAADIFRNRFAVVGGFAKRMMTSKEVSDIRRWSKIILDEVEKAERALDRWMDARKRGISDWCEPDQTS